MNYKYMLLLTAGFFVVWMTKGQQSFDPSKFSTDGQIGIYEHLDETIPSDILLTNQDSVLVNL